MRRSIMIIVAITVIVLISIIYLAPSTDDFNPENIGWNGISDFLQKFDSASIIDRLDEKILFNPPNTTLLIIGPEKSFTKHEADILIEYIKSGGIVILADDFGSGNELLKMLDVGLSLDGSLLVDPLFNEKDKNLPKIIHLRIDEVDELVFNYATIVKGCPSSIAYSSSYSYLDLNLNGMWDDEPKGPFEVACKVRIGRGELIVISDSSIIINSMLKLGDNLGFLEKLILDRRVLVDGSHWIPSTLTFAKEVLNSLISMISIPELRYTILIGIVFMVMRYKIIAEEIKSEIEKILMRNPGWDRELLTKLEREMRGER